jgi:hypothetical protein
VEKKRNTRRNVDEKLLREERYLKMLLLQKKKNPRKKEGMCTWILQEHMNIMRHGWLN